MYNSNYIDDLIKQYDITIEEYTEEIRILEKENKELRQRITWMKLHDDAGWR